METHCARVFSSKLNKGFRNHSSLMLVTLNKSNWTLDSKAISWTRVDIFFTVSLLNPWASKNRKPIREILGVAKSESKKAWKPIEDNSDG